MPQLTLEKGGHFPDRIDELRDSFMGAIATSRGEAFLQIAEKLEALSIQYPSFDSSKGDQLLKEDLCQAARKLALEAISNGEELDSAVISEFVEYGFRSLLRRNIADSKIRWPFRLVHDSYHASVRRLSEVNPREDTLNLYKSYLLVKFIRELGLSYLDTSDPDSNALQSGMELVYRARAISEVLVTMAHRLKTAMSVRSTLKKAPQIPGLMEAVGRIADLAEQSFEDDEVRVQLSDAAAQADAVLEVELS